MTAFARGFRYELLDEQPNGQPVVGYEFEYEWPPVGPNCSNFGERHIDTFRVTGWEKHIDAEGNDRISVCVWPVARRTRRVRSMTVTPCNLGHQHPVFEYDDNEPCRGVAPRVWGTRSEERAAR